MIVIVATMKAQAGKEKEMEDALKEMVSKVGTEEGVIEYVLHRSQKEPGEFMFYEKYKDKDVLELHGKTPHMKELIGKMGSLVDGGPKIALYEEIAAK